MLGPKDPRWKRLRALFDERVELPREHRAQELARLATTDVELARELAALLEAPAEDAWLEPLGWMERVGPWQLEGEAEEGERRARHGSSGAPGLLRRLPLETPGLHGVARVRELAPRLLRFAQARVARVLDAGLCTESSGARAALYLVEQPVALGRPLAAHLADRARTPRERVASLAHACEALAAVHAARLVHGDLGPASLRVDERGEPVVRGLGARMLCAPAFPPWEGDVRALGGLLPALSDLEAVRGRWPSPDSAPATAAELARELEQILPS